jgi:hypothetical protein
MSIALLSAAALALLTFVVHTVFGGRDVAVPLRRAVDLPRMPKLTAYYCWHIVTIMLFVLAGALGYAALVEPHNRALVVVCLLLAAGCAVWNIALIIGSRASPWRELPQWTLFVAISTPIAWHLARG